MSTEPNPTTHRDSSGAIWRYKPVPTEPRPWLLAGLTLGCIALVVAGSIGPWLYVVRGPEWAPEVETLPGTANDGVFSLFFAVIAATIVIVTMIWPDRWVLAWGAFVAMMLCSLVGLFDWVIFDPMDLAHMPGKQVSLIRVEWGLKLITLAAPAGAISALLYARHLTHGDY
jgi:hypothetical protein